MTQLTTRAEASDEDSSKGAEDGALPFRVEPWHQFAGKRDTDGGMKYRESQLVIDRYEKFRASSSGRSGWSVEPPGAPPPR